MFDPIRYNPHFFKTKLDKLLFLGKFFQTNTQYYFYILLVKFSYERNIFLKNLILSKSTNVLGHRPNKKQQCAAACLKNQNRKKPWTESESENLPHFSLPVIMSSKRPPIRYLDLYKVKHRNISRRSSKTSQNVKNNTKQKSVLNFLPQGIGVRLVRFFSMKNSAVKLLN